MFVCAYLHALSNLDLTQRETSMQCPAYQDCSYFLKTHRGLLSEPLKLCHRLAAIHLTSFPTQPCLPRCRPQFSDSRCVTLHG